MSDGRTYQIGGEHLRIATVNGQVAAPVVLTREYSHHENHNGTDYISGGTMTLGSGGSANISFTTPAGPDLMHFTYQLSSTGQLNWQAYEGGTVSGGATVPSYNHNRNYPDATTMVILLNPTITAMGSAITPPAVSGSGQTQSGSDRSLSEYILKPSTTYLWTLLSGAASNLIDWKVNWYEHGSD